MGRRVTEALGRICMESLPPAREIVVLEDTLLRISFEGIYFPVEEVLAYIRKNIEPDWTGKLDVLDLEAWTLDRHVFESGAIHHGHAPLNNVLDYSGH